MDRGNLLAGGYRMRPPPASRSSSIARAWLFLCAARSNVVGRAVIGEGEERTERTPDDAASVLEAAGQSGESENAGPRGPRLAGNGLAVALKGNPVLATELFVDFVSDGTVGVDKIQDIGGALVGAPDVGRGGHRRVPVRAAGTGAVTAEPSADGCSRDANDATTTSPAPSSSPRPIWLAMSNTSPSSRARSRSAVSGCFLT